MAIRVRRTDVCDEEEVKEAEKRPRKVEVVPYVKVRDFNMQGADEFEDNPPKTGIEIGLKFTF